VRLDGNLEQGVISPVLGHDAKRVRIRIKAARLRFSDALRFWLRLRQQY
jgi:hypothetical protein